MSSKTNGLADDRIKSSGKQKSKTEKTEKAYRVRSHGTNHFNGKMSGEKKQQRKRKKEFDLKPEDKSNLLPHD